MVASIDREVGDNKDEFGRTIRERALNSIDKLVYGPPDRKKRLYSMIETRPDWVLSDSEPGVYPHLLYKKRHCQQIVIFF